MNVPDSIDVTDTIHYMRLSDKIIPHLQPNGIRSDCMIPRTEEYSFSLLIRPSDNALQLLIEHKKTAFRRTMKVNTKAQKLGILIELTQWEIMMLIQEGLPLIHSLSANQSPKNDLAT